MAWNLKSAQEVIAVEGLPRWAVFVRPDRHADRVGVWEDHLGWHVGSSDEPGVLLVDKAFDTEQDALDEFVGDLRLTKRLAERFNH